MRRRTSSPENPADRPIISVSRDLSDDEFSDDSSCSLQHPPRKQELDHVSDFHLDTLGGVSLFEDEVSGREFRMNVHDFFHSSRSRQPHTDSSNESISNEDDAVQSYFSSTSSSLVHKSRYRETEHENQDGGSKWTSVIEEADKLISLQKKNNCSPARLYTSEARKNCQGGADRTKPKFSIRSRPHNEVFFYPELKGENGNPVGWVNKVPSASEHLESELKGNFVAGALPSVVELLEDLQGKCGPSFESDVLCIHNSRGKQKKRHASEKRNSSSLCSKVLHYEDSPELLEREYARVYEYSEQDDLNIPIHKVKTQSMADRFQEAFSSGEINENLYRANRQCGSIYGRLQQSIQHERQKHLEFLKQLQSMESFVSESRCINVQILSRVLEGKLTVCNCLFIGYTKDFELSKYLGNTESMENEGTVIFSSKVCENVDIDVGNLVRINPPWNEVHINEGRRRIVLCTYFSRKLA